MLYLSNCFLLEFGRCSSSNPHTQRMTNHFLNSISSPLSRKALYDFRPTERDSKHTDTWFMAAQPDHEVTPAPTQRRRPTWLMTAVVSMLEAVVMTMASREEAEWRSALLKVVHSRAFTSRVSRNIATRSTITRCPGGGGDSVVMQWCRGYSTVTAKAIKHHTAFMSAPISFKINGRHH